MIPRLVGPARGSTGGADPRDRRAEPLEERAVPIEGPLGTTGDGGGPPNARQRARRFCARLRALRVLHRVRRGPGGVEQAEEPGEVDRLARSVEDVALAFLRDAEAKRRLGSVQV